jgi:hypothetical protein
MDLEEILSGSTWFCFKKSSTDPFCLKSIVSMDYPRVAVTFLGLFPRTEERDVMGGGGGATAFCITCMQFKFKSWPLSVTLSLCQAQEMLRFIVPLPSWQMGALRIFCTSTETFKYVWAYKSRVLFLNIFR